MLSIVRRERQGKWKDVKFVNASADFNKRLTTRYRPVKPEITYTNDALKRENSANRYLLYRNLGFNIKGIWRTKFWD